uniref:BTB domain-containing protein n=1 Tax=Macrostomum lignano TaxID=282301 RepID=A0A1I8JNU3_9PLAT
AIKQTEGSEINCDKPLLLRLDGTLDMASVSSGHGGGQWQCPKSSNYLKFAINIPYSDVKRMLETDTRPAVLALKDCSRAGRVNWKLKLYTSTRQHRSKLPGALPEIRASGVHRRRRSACNTEFSVRLTGSRQSQRGWSARARARGRFSKADDSWGWSQRIEVLRLSGVIKIYESSKLLYTEKEAQFYSGAERPRTFRIQVGQVTFHVHRTVLVLNSDYFLPPAFSRQDSEVARAAALMTLLDEKVAQPDLPSCLQFVDTQLSSESVEPEKAMKYYFICIRWLRCPDLAEQCVRSRTAAAGPPSAAAPAEAGGENGDFDGASAETESDGKTGQVKMNGVHSDHSEDEVFRGFRLMNVADLLCDSRLVVLHWRAALSWRVSNSEASVAAAPALASKQNWERRLEAVQGGPAVLPLDSGPSKDRGVLLYMSGRHGDYMGLYLRQGRLNYFIFNPSRLDKSLWWSPLLLCRLWMFSFNQALRSGEQKEV